MSADARARGRRRTLFWLGAITLLALLLRLPNLGCPDFEVDEVLHAHAAASLLNGEGPLLPDGRAYKRALLFTRLVAASGRLLGLDEFSARLPGVLFGVGTPLLLYLIGRFWYSERVGVVAAVVAVMAPSQIVFSRTLRMYVVFQFLFLLLIFLLFHLSEPRARLAAASPPAARAGSDRRLVAEKLALMLLIVPCFLLTEHLHRLVLPALLGPVAFLLVRTLQSCGRWRIHRRDCVYRAVLLAAGFSAGVSFFLLTGRRLTGYLSQAQFAPAWAAASREEPSFYVGGLVDQFSWLFLLIAALGVFLRHREQAVTWYLTICFGVPLALHSLGFAWRSQRYIFHLLPLLYLLFAAGLDALMGRAASSWERRWGGGARPGAVWNRLTVVALVGLIFWTGWPGQAVGYLRSAVTAAEGIWHNNWKEAMAVVQEQEQDQDQGAVVTTKPLLVAYYGRGRDLYMLNRRVELKHDPHFAAGGGEIRTLQDLERLLVARGVVWFVCERWLYYDAASVPPAVRQYVEDNGTRIYVERAADMVISRLARPPNENGRSSVRRASGNRAERRQL